MAGLTPYFTFDGIAREALEFYASTFGGTAELNTFADFGRDDGPGDAIAHGILRDSPVELFAADAAGDEKAFAAEGVLFSLLGTADPATLHAWFTRLSEGGTVVDDLQQRPWGGYDGQVVDRFGVTWLLGYELDQPA